MRQSPQGSALGAGPRRAPPPGWATPRGQLAPTQLRLCGGRTGAEGDRAASPPRPQGLEPAVPSQQGGLSRSLTLTGRAQGTEPDVRTEDRGGGGVRKTQDGLLTLLCEPEEPSAPLAPPYVMQG